MFLAGYPLRSSIQIIWAKTFQKSEAVLGCVGGWISEVLKYQNVFFTTPLLIFCQYLIIK